MAGDDSEVDDSASEGTDDPANYDKADVELINDDLFMERDDIPDGITKEMLSTLNGLDCSAIEDIQCIAHGHKNWRAFQETHELSSDEMKISKDTMRPYMENASRKRKAIMGP